MAVPRRLRFEILRRDNHTCRYCGRTAPEVKLTVDHVTPTVLGGSDDPSNLVTACADCNGGKSSNSVGADVVANVAEDALRWQQAIKAVADQRSSDRDAAAETARRFRDNWMFQYERLHHVKCHDHEDDWCRFELPANYASTVGELLAAGLTTDDLIEAVRQAWGQDFYVRDLWRYFCGVAWKIVTAQAEAARLLLDGQADDAENPIPPLLRVPVHDLLRLLLATLIDDDEIEGHVAMFAAAEENWRRALTDALERGFHRERARREALDSAKYHVIVTANDLYKAQRGREAVARFKADVAARKRA